MCVCVSSPTLSLYLTAACHSCSLLLDACPRRCLPNGPLVPLGPLALTGHGAGTVFVSVPCDDRDPAQSTGRAHIVDRSRTQAMTPLSEPGLVICKIGVY